MESKLGLFLRSLRVRRNLSVEKIEFRLDGTNLKVQDFESHPETLPSDKIALYLTALDVSAEEYQTFCEISILEFGRRSSRVKANNVIKERIKKLKKIKGGYYGKPIGKVAEASRSLRRKY